MWAYSYQIEPPQPEGRLLAIRALLDQEHAAAKHEARIWAGRIVCEPQNTRILIVTDTPDQERDIDRRLQETLHELHATVTISAPMGLFDDP